jgi:hypothetical protein
MLKDFEQFDGYTKKAGKFLEFLLLEFYKHDLDHPITSRSIKTMTHRVNREGPYRETTGLSGVEVRAIVHFLREEGYPIGSRGSGYYWCRSEEDKQVTLDHLRQRVRSITRAYNGLEKADLDKSPSNTLHMGQIGMVFNG